MEQKIDNNIYKDAFETYGMEKNCGFLAEETGELLSAVNKFRRGRDTEDHVIEELVDVYQVIKAFAEHFGYQKFIVKLKEKRNRLMETIENIKNEENAAEISIKKGFYYYCLENLYFSYGHGEEYEWAKGHVYPAYCDGVLYDIHGYHKNVPLKYFRVATGDEISKDESFIQNLLKEEFHEFKLTMPEKIYFAMSNKSRLSNFEKVYLEKYHHCKEEDLEDWRLEEIKKEANEFLEIARHSILESETSDVQYKKGYKKAIEDAIEWLQKNQKGFMLSELDIKEFENDLNSKNL